MTNFLAGIACGLLIAFGSIGLFCALFVAGMKDVVKAALGA